MPKEHEFFSLNPRKACASSNWVPFVGAPALTARRDNRLPDPKGISCTNLIHPSLLPFSIYILGKTQHTNNLINNSREPFWNTKPTNLLPTTYRLCSRKFGKHYDTGLNDRQLKYLRTKPRKVIEASPCIVEMGAMIQCWTASGVDDAKCAQTAKMLADCMKLVRFFLSLRETLTHLSRARISSQQ